MARPVVTGEGSLLQAVRQAAFMVLAFAVLVAIWSAIVLVFRPPNYILPPPESVLGSLHRGLVGALDSGGLLARQAYYKPIWDTLQVTVVGFAAGAIVGITTGIALAEFPRAERVFMPYVSAFQALPKVALAPLFIIWFGYGASSRTFMAAILVVFPVMINTLNGFHQVDVMRLELAHSYKADRLQVVRYVKFPSALPFIISGLEIGIVYALIGAVVGELVAGNEGLGSRLMSSSAAMDISGMFAILVVLGVMGAALHMLARAAKQRILFWP